MRWFERVTRTLVILVVFGVSAHFALQFGNGGLWHGLGAAHAVTPAGESESGYDLTQLTAVNETLDTIRKKYVEPSRVKPRQMFLSALDQVQREVAQVIVLHDERSPTVKVKVDTEEKEFRVDNVQGPWDVSARLREVFAFMQTHLKNTDVELKDVEYAACNGMLRTLDPHSVFLSPEAFAEMNLSTSGHFGGLGIVISIRDQSLTVMKPMPSTPAGRAGLRRLDRITKINNESTLNMPLDDAVKRLRGKPGSKVTVWVHRDGNDGWSGAKPFELVREEIRIESVDSEQLAPSIGYVRIKQFQASTSDELDAALEKLGKKNRLKGLVLDLRGNPGGLLDQAAKVADKFLERGVIVATVGGSEAREEKQAKRRGTEPPYAMVVLANASSASASEIVAGALKNHDRAIVVGQTTFGKGTVQLVFPHIAGGAALKLTIAEYLTPGDVSIQGFGVAPDIELDPMTADTQEMDLFRSEHRPSERDLTNSLSNGAQRSSDGAAMTLRYNLPERERFDMIERGGDMEDEFQLDFPIEFARDLVSRLKRAGGAEQLASVQEFIEGVEQAEISAVSEDLKKLGIDWSPPPKAKQVGATQPSFDVKVTTDRPNDTVVAGQPMALKVTVKNNSEEPVYQLRAITKSDSGYYDEKELVFGRIDPGRSKTAVAVVGWCETEGRKPGSTKPLPLDAKRVCRLPMNAVTRQDVVRVRFNAAGGEAPEPVEIRPTVHSLPRPIFAYTYHVVDNRPGNGDGQLTRGEGATVYLTVKNVGKGRSYDTQANLSNVTGDGLLLRAGRFDVSNMLPGDTREVAFTFDVLDLLKDNFAKVELSIADRDLQVVSSEKVTFPVLRASAKLSTQSGRVEIKKGARVREKPLKEARVVGQLGANAVVDKTGTIAGFVRVSLGGNRFGFVEAEELTDTSKPLSRLDFEPLLARSPPLVEVTPAQLATRGEKVRIKGVAKDADRVLDMYIFVGTRKVFYHSNGKASDPTTMPFDLEVELTPGVNVIHVVARESEDTASRQTLVVRRDGPGGEALPTPKSDVFGADWEFESTP